MIKILSNRANAVYMSVEIGPHQRILEFELSFWMDTYSAYTHDFGGMFKTLRGRGATPLEAVNDLLDAIALCVGEWYIEISEMNEEEGG